MKQLQLLLIAVLMMLAKSAYSDSLSIFDAIQKGDVAQVEKILAAGTDINIRNKAPGSYTDNLTPLLFALVSGKPECVKLLVEKGADVNATNGAAEISPLHAAVMVQSPAMVEYLIAHGANINAQNDMGKTPLYMAAFANSEPDKISAAILIAKGADMNIRDKEGFTAKELIQKHQEEARLNAEFKKQQEAERLEAERKQAAASGKHRYGDNAYRCISGAFINTCDAMIEVTINRNQFCNGGIFRVPPGHIISISQECKGFVTYTAIYLGD